MNRTNRRCTALVSTLTLAAVAASLLTACGRREANPTITLAISNNVAQNRLLELLIPSAHAAVTSGKLCIRRLRFKRVTPVPSPTPSPSATHSADDSDSDSWDDEGHDVNVDFSPGEVQ